MISFAVSAMAAEALFPRPLHITRRIEDPVAHSTTTVHEYCAGDQVITVSGEKITIADHARQELTEIDRAAGTYSVTTFAALAEASMAMRPITHRRVAAALSNNQQHWTATAHARDAFDVTFPAESAGPAKMEIALDRSIHLSKAALEVLIGAAFPNPRSDVHEAILDLASRVPGGDRRVATNATPADVSYALPVEQNATFVVDGESITIKSSVVDVRSELAPPGTVTIPPGARLVESHSVRLAREVREADQLPNAPRH